MKMLKNIGFFALLVFAMVACVEKTPDYANFPTKDVDFTYNVDGSEYTLDFYVVSTIQFNNTSAKQGAVTWDFGDGTATSSEANPKHKYAKAGRYNVTLKVDGVGQRTYPILIYDITPVLSVTSQSEGTLVINDVTIDLGIELPNPENLKCKYIWKFPEGTLKADGTPIEEYEGYSHEDGSIDNPGALKFKNIGSQRIELQTWFDIDGENRRLDNSFVNVQVGFTKEVPTVYYAVWGGNIKAYKIIPHDELPEGTKNLPFDLGITSGNTPGSLVFKTVTDENGNENDYIYILDRGKQSTYLNDPLNRGDGKISVMSADGTYANTVITNVGGHAYTDPFQGCADDTYLYYTDRNKGIHQVKLTARGEVEKADYETGNGYFVYHQQLGYYGRGISWGAFSGDLCLSNNVFYWSLHEGGGNSVYRFTTADIGKLNEIPHPIILNNSSPRALAIDENHGKLYLWSGPNGLYQYNIPDINGSLKFEDYTNCIKMESEKGITNAKEEIYTTQLAVDKTTGNVFFGFRTADAAYTTGLYYYDYAAGKVVNYEGNTDKILGVAINPRKTKLF